MKIKYLKFKNWLLVSLMSLLGLNACRSGKEVVSDKTDVEGPTPRNEIMLLYGVPPRDYQKIERAEEVKDTPKEEPADPKSDPEDVVIPSNPPRNQMIAMYGVPTVDFSLKGRVVDAHGKPVKNAQVILLNSNIDADADYLPDTEYWQNYIKKVSDTTDAEGNFEVKTTDRPWEQVRVLVRDVDGKDNGSFRNEVFQVDFSDAEQVEQPQGWYQGTKEKKDVTLSVKEK